MNFIIISNEKAEKLVTNLYDTTQYAIHIRNSKQALNHGLLLENVHRRNNFEKELFKLINNSVPRKTIENTRKNRNIKLVTTERRGRNCLVSEPNNHTIKFFIDNLLPIKMR